MTYSKNTTLDRIIRTGITRHEGTFTTRGGTRTVTASQLFAIEDHLKAIGADFEDAENQSSYGITRGGRRLNVATTFNPHDLNRCTVCAHVAEYR